MVVGEILERRSAEPTSLAHVAPDSVRSSSLQPWPLLPYQATSRRRLPPSVFERQLVLAFGDLAIIALALVLAQRILWFLNFPVPSYRENWLWLVGIALLYLGLAWVRDAYDPDVFASPIASASRMLQAFGAMVVTLGVAAYLVQTVTRPRVTPALFVVLAVSGLTVWRLTFAWVAPRTRLRRNLLIVGAGVAGQTTARDLQRHLSRYFNLVGFIDDDPAKQNLLIAGHLVLGDRHRLVQICAEQQVHEILVAITHSIEPGLVQAIITSYEMGIQVMPMATFYESVTGRIPVEHIGYFWHAALPVQTHRKRLYRLFRRVVDVVVASLALLPTGLLVLPILALVIKLDSPGPVFYRQERLGKYGHRFQVIKLRSMRQDAERDGARWAKPGDDRVTRVGRWLRRTRLDELPQLINVLRGEMSLIGPRPERPDFVVDLEQQIPLYRGRLLVEPGLTGWAQVRYRYGASVEDALVKLQYDLYYIKHQSLALDLLIMLKTIGVILSFKGT